MKKNIFYFSVVLTFLFSACERVENLDSPLSVKMEEMTFYAYMEGAADTKTAIEGNVGDDVRYLKWLSGDSIGIYNTSFRTFEKFININPETASTAIFNGVNNIQDVYYAVYPYSELHSFSSGVLTVDLPFVQHYSVNTFGNNANPMVAYAVNGEELKFQNLCGVLVINLTGEVLVKSITLTLSDEFGDMAGISGKHTVSMDYVESPTLKRTDESAKAVTLDCGDGVQLNASEPTPFHIVIPAGSYGGVNITVLTVDGQIMVKQSKNDLNIKRSRVISAGALEYFETISVDLSERGTSNCYIVSEPGVYSFDATVIGNGEFGLIPEVGFHTDDVNITPVSVELLWEDVPGLVQSVNYVNGRAGFYCSGIEGNAVLAAKDTDGTIIWSWHIWSTTKPEELTYVNDAGIYTIMDRNIGAVRADRGTGDEWKESVGLLYQWGRKDPFLKDLYKGDRKKDISTIEKSIQYPDYHSTLSSWNAQSHWEANHNNVLWRPGKKTIYDPCPVGYIVPDVSAYYGSYVNGESDMGCYVSLDESTQSWFPVTPMIHCNGSYRDAEGEIIVWSSSITSDNSFSRLHIKKSEENNINYWEGMDNAAMASPVRCVKEAGFVDISLPQTEILEISDVTTTSAKIRATIKSSGLADVIERGVVYSTKADFSDAVKAKCTTNGVGEYICTLDGLTPGATYYIKAYAANLRGEAREINGMVFSTSCSDDIVNLSAYGTANSYIVPPMKGRYSFACNVKSNSMEQIGVPHSLEVLWETFGCSSVAEAGTLVSSVNLIGGSNAVLELAVDGIEGNALIAAKDNNGTILWSWHIWVTDKPAEQTYQNSEGTFVVLDRNIGATRADRGEGDEWLDSRGLVYFWGRKDPFWYGSYSEAKGFMTVEQSVANPTMRHTTRTWASDRTSWLGDLQHIPTLWAFNTKTQYDPCPLGYRVAVNKVWSGLVSDDSLEFNVKGGFNNGWEFYIDNTDTVTAWYPSNYWMNWSSGYNTWTNQGAVWAANYTTGSNKSYLYNDADEILPSGLISDGHGLPVRCMKE